MLKNPTDFYIANFNKSSSIRTSIENSGKKNLNWIVQRYSTSSRLVCNKPSHFPSPGLEFDVCLSHIKHILRRVNQLHKLFCRKKKKKSLNWSSTHCIRSALYSQTQQHINMSTHGN